MTSPTHALPRLLTLLAPLFAPLAAVFCEEAPALLERTRVRVLCGDEQLSVHAEGTLSANGVEGVISFVAEADGAFLWEARSELGDSLGWDGESGWRETPTGLVRPERRFPLRFEILRAWLISGHWLVDPALEIRAEDANTLRVVFSGTDLDVAVHVDDTGLPVSFVRESSGGTSRYTFGPFSEVGGRLFPAFLRRVTQSGVASVWNFSSLEEVESGLVATRRPRPKLPSDTEFDLDLDPRLETRSFRSGHVAVRPRVNGVDLGWFLFDSGAGATCISTTAAESLGLATLGTVQALGSAGSTTGRLRRAKTFQLGPVTIRDARLLELDLDFLQQAMGTEIAGIVGYNLIARTNVVFEPNTARIELHPPEAFEAEPLGWSEIIFDGNQPCVHARFEGDHEGYFRIDTGAGGNVTFHTPTVRRLRLLEGRKTTKAMAGGVGGQNEVARGTLAWFELGGRRFESPTVEFALFEHGALADEDVLGNIGQGFLAGYTLIFDYPHGRMAFLEPEGY